jgi:hypothetical protein
MRLAGFIGVALASLLVASCATPAPPPEKPETFWFNVEALKQSATAEDLKRYSTATDRDTAECNMEKFKIAIPAPSCVPRNCESGNTFCRALGPVCDDSAVKSAYRSRNELFKACMASRGYGEFTLEDFSRFYPDQLPKLEAIVAAGEP